MITKRHLLPRHIYSNNAVRVFFDYGILLKPKIVLLVVFTALMSMLAAPNTLSLSDSIIVLLCIAIGAGAGGALNMCLEKDIDALMRRTQERPLVKNRLKLSEAFFFGLSLSMTSVITMAVFIDYLAAFFLALAIIYYVVIYTIWLKRRTVHNVVIGGAAGAFPPVVGWVAATGQLELLPWLMFAIIFLWTPPHSWALAYFCADDYRKAKIPMLPVNSNFNNMRMQIIIYSIAMVIVSLLPWQLGFSGNLYGIVAIVLGGIFIFLGFTISAHSKTQSIRLFAFSIFYLFSIFTFLAVDTKIGYGI